MFLFSQYIGIHQVREQIPHQIAIILTRIPRLRAHLRDGIFHQIFKRHRHRTLLALGRHFRRQQRQVAKQNTIYQPRQLVLLARLAKIIPGEHLVHVNLEPVQLGLQRLVVLRGQPVQIDRPEGTRGRGVQQGHYVVRRRGIAGNLKVDHDAVRRNGSRSKDEVFELKRIWPSHGGPFPAATLTMGGGCCCSFGGASFDV
uniref:(northern house mosquito) hypothetical protein n=1 Tax=Culex pipiens TaxID=7175 RepID=A0A8D8ASZ3_CULPI